LPESQARQAGCADLPPGSVLLQLQSAIFSKKTQYHLPSKPDRIASLPPASAADGNKQVGPQSVRRVSWRSGAHLDGGGTITPAGERI